MGESLAGPRPRLQANWRTWWGSVVKNCHKRHGYWHVSYHRKPADRRINRLVDEGNAAVQEAKKFVTEAEGLKQTMLKTDVSHLADARATAKAAIEAYDKAKEKCKEASKKYDGELVMQNLRARRRRCFTNHLHARRECEESQSDWLPPEVSLPYLLCRFNGRVLK